MRPRFPDTQSIRAIAILLGLACAAPALSAPRDTVDSLASLVDNNFYDPQKARDIADELRRDAKAGAFDSMTDPRDLASQLTRRLKPFDRHFNVTWTGAPSGARAPGSSLEIPALLSEASDRRSSYGFRSVEMLPGAIGYIDMRFFADFSSAKPGEPARAAADAALQLVSGADAVIIDLRYNGGGSPAMVGYLVSAFVPADANVYNVILRRNGSESERPKLLYPHPRMDVPLYVLISGRTASAAESTAYTLQAARRATIVGEPSVGAANPGGELPVGEGFNVFVPTGSPMNPVTRKNWEGIGVQPDMRVPSEHALARAEILALEAVLARNEQGPRALDSRWTLEALRAEQTPPAGPPLSEYAGVFGDATVSTAAGRLVLQRGRQPPLALMRFGGDGFFVRSEPFRRVLFERDADGQVKGFEFVRSTGQSIWYPRSKE
jgi:hypothetical protein